MKRSLLVLIPVASVGLMLFATAHVYTEQQPMQKSAPPASPTRAAFGNSVAATGIVEPSSQNIFVGSALSGTVLEVYVPAERVGTPVHRGDALFRVDDRHLKAQLAAAEARMGAAAARLNKLREQPRPEEIPPSEAKVAAAKANAERARDEFERIRPLTPHAVSAQELIAKQMLHEQAVQEWKQAEKEHAMLLAGAWEPDLAIARADVEQARAEVAQCRTEIERATVRSPIAGVVLQVNIREGEYVSERMQDGLVVLGRVDRLHVRADIDEHDIPYFCRTGKAVAHLRGQAHCDYSLQLVRVEPYVVAKRWLTGDNTERIDTRVLQVVYAVDADDAPMFVGQQVDVCIEAGTGDSPLASSR